MKQKCFNLLDFIYYGSSYILIRKELCKRKIKTYKLLQRRTILLWIYLLFIKIPNTRSLKK